MWENAAWNWLAGVNGSIWKFMIEKAVILSLVAKIASFIHFSNKYFQVPAAVSESWPILKKE